MLPQQTSFSESHPNVIAWLENYQGSSEFYLSLLSQFRTKGYLSEKQVACVQKAIDSEKPKQVMPDAPWENPTFENGTVVCISKGIAGNISKNVGLPFTYRNIEIVKTHRETEKGLNVTFKFSSKVGTHCSICGLPLTDEISCATGIGPTCARKTGIARTGKEEAQEVINTLEQFLDQVGEVTLWLPKFYVKKVDLK